MQLGSRNMGSPIEQRSPVTLQPILASGSSQVSVAATSTAPLPSQQQRSQPQYAPQLQQTSNVHMPSPHVLQVLLTLILSLTHSLLIWDVICKEAECEMII